MANLYPISESAPIQEVESNSTGAQEVRKSRYNATCPACKSRILAGQPVVIHSHRPGGRPRWKHEDCNNIPPGENGTAVISSGEIPAEIVDRLAAVENKIDEIASAAPVRHEIIIRQPNGAEVKMEGFVHEAFQRVLDLAMARKNIFLPGPAGCGKTHLARQVAEALGMKFGTISCSAGMSESQILGRLVPAGENGQFVFLSTQFLECYENGGVFLFDEIDAADPNVLLVINSALANGHLSVPARHENPMAARHPDFVFIAAANTFGHGADRQYVGRNQLDESTLDRFRIGTVPMDYALDLERQLCPIPALLERLTDIRVRVRENRLNRIVSTRFIKEAYEMIANWGWTISQVEAQLFSGWREDEIRKARS